MGMNENSLQDKRLNQMVFGFIMVCGLFLGGISRTETFKNGLETGNGHNQGIQKLIQFPILGLVA